MRRVPSPGSAASGFTLLEVLVATAILGTAIAGLFSLLTGALTNARRLQAPEQAILLGRSQLNELLAASEQVRDGGGLRLEERKQGQWGRIGNEEYRWEALAQRVAPEREAQPGQPILVRVLFDVFWRSVDRPDTAEKRMTLETYQLWQQPARSGL